MEITGLSKKGKYQIRVEIDGSYAFFLYGKDIKKLKIKEGDQINEQLIEDIYQLLLYPRAREKALSLLQYRARTTFEMRRKLMEIGYPAKITDQVMDFLEDYHYLDDRAYARSYIEIQGKNKGPKRLRQELANKGIDREVFSSIWEGLDEDQEEVSLEDLMKKKIKDPADLTRENYNKYAAFFLRKGFSPALVHKKLKACFDGADEESYSDF